MIDKPKGPTSHDVVAQLRRALKVKKVGHTGTLDPMATGVLPICIGEATKVAQFITDGDKAYEAVVVLGTSTDTLDAEGKVTGTGPVPPLDKPTLEAVLERFRGTSAQVPPMYSAVKVGGKRLYELARAGEEVERQARQVTVHSLSLLDFSASQLTLQVACSKGFFVRSLANDIGAALGCGAHLAALRRTKSGSFTLAQSITLAMALDEGLAVERRLVPAANALSELPAVTVSAAEAQVVAHGGLVEVSHPDGLVRVQGPTGALLAIADVERGRLKYRRVLLWP